MAIDTTPARPGPSAVRRSSVRAPAAARMSARERAFFTERLALLLETGSSLHPALDVLARQAASPGVSAVVARLRDDIAGGRSFAQALAAHPTVFDATYVNLVGAAEQAGFLPDVLRQLIRLDEKTAELRGTVVSAFTYPAFLTTFAGAVVVFVLVVVFPKFAEMFSVIEDQLPVTTIALIAVSDVLREHVGWVLGGLAMVLGSLGWWIASPSGGLVIDRLKLSVPGLKTLFTELYFAQSLWVIGISLSNGVSVPDALRACREVVRNRVFRAFIEEVERDVQEGRGVSAAFARSPFVPALTKQMVETGERSGNLGLVLTRVAQFYERELAARLKTFSKLAEPVLLLVMGVVVGLIVASLILPIFKLSKAVR